MNFSPFEFGAPAAYRDIPVGGLFLAPFKEGAVLAIRVEDIEGAADMVLAQSGVVVEPRAPLPLALAFGALGGGADLTVLRIDDTVAARVVPSKGANFSPVLADKPANGDLLIAGGSHWIAYRHPDSGGALTYYNLETGRQVAGDYRPAAPRLFIREWELVFSSPTRRDAVSLAKFGGAT